MKRIILLVKFVLLFAATILVADDTKDAATKKELEKLQGRWKIVSVERGGKEEKPANSFGTVTGDKFSTKSGDEVVREGSLRIDPTQKPKAIDATYTTGPDKGKTLQGIYVLEGDAWKIAYSGPGKDRLKELPDKPGVAYLVLTLKRDK